MHHVEVTTEETLLCVDTGLRKSHSQWLSGPEWSLHPHVGVQLVGFSSE